MSDLSTDFSKITVIPEKFEIDTNLSDIELIKSAKKYIKQRIVTNLNVPTYSTQFNYYGGYEIRLKQIYDKYIRYDQIKMFLKFIDLISLKDFDYMFYTSNFDRELNLYIRCLASHKDLGDLDIGSWNLILSHESENTDLYNFLK